MDPDPSLPDLSNDRVLPPFFKKAAVASETAGVVEGHSEVALMLE